MVTRLLGAAIVGVVMALSACTGEAPEPTPTPYVGEFTRGRWSR